MIETENRWLIFRMLAPYFGRVVSASFIQKTSRHISGLTRIHNLIEGIYKPMNATYALSIASMLKNPYADKIAHDRDGSWYFYYSPKAGSLDLAVNRSLFNCMRDSEPVLVLKQVSDKTHREGSRYKMLGLGMLDEFDRDENLFKIRQVTIDRFQERIDPQSTLSDDLIETALQLETLREWTPFAAENRAVYNVSREKRDSAFRKIVLENYENSCAVLKSKFAFNSVVEAEAAHIIGKHVNGTDDPRNGVALSKTAHWAFDQGIFTITDDFEVMVHPIALLSSNNYFPILSLDKTRIILPNDESNYPHLEALGWHRENVYGVFAR